MHPDSARPPAAGAPAAWRTIERENSVAVAIALGVRGAVFFGDDDRLAAELDGEGLRDRQHRRGRRDRGVRVDELTGDPSRCP